LRNEAQLRRLFDQTLDGLPEDDRLQIIALWEKHGIRSEMENGARRYFPEIRMVGEFVDLPMRFAQTDGIKFDFKSIAVDKAPDDILQGMIAHELAHAHRVAEFNMPFFEARTEKEEEDVAIERAGTWGFPADPVNQWIEENINSA
jgi:hypothetical protein